MSVKPPASFSFVPHQSGNSRPNDRRFINTHLSRLAAERRRHGKGTSKTVKANRNSHAGAAALAKVAIPRSLPELGPPRIEPGDAAVGSTEHFSTSEESSPEQPLSPVTLLDNGSYDPFESTLVPITKEARRLLLFDHEIFHPFILKIEKGADKDGAFSNKFNYTTCAALADECTGYATLARIANAAAMVTGDRGVQMMALTYKSRAYESLRNSISTNGGRSSEHLLSQMFSLLSMEIVGQQHEHATLHARTLRQLIQSEGENVATSECMNKKLLNSILWHECLRGAFTLCRPEFDIEQLVDHTKFLRTLLGVKDKLTKLGLMPEEPINGFQEAGLRSHLLMRLREYRFLIRLCHGLQQFPGSIDDDFMTAFSFRAILSSSKLHEFYNDAWDEIKAVRGLKNQNLTSAYTETATALAAIFWYRAATSHEAVDVPPTTQTQMYKVFGTQKPALHHLREAITYCKTFGGVSDQPHLWLWIMYVGSLAERADLHPRCDPEESIASYFHSELYSLARKLGIRTWESMEEILSRFLYAEKIGPMSKALFERAMGRG